VIRNNKAAGKDRLPHIKVSAEGSGEPER
jgi:hypothetical protein